MDFFKKKVNEFDAVNAFIDHVMTSAITRWPNIYSGLRRSRTEVVLLSITKSSPSSTFTLPQWLRRCCHFRASLRQTKQIDYAAGLSTS